MADQLDIGGLRLSDSQHATAAMGGGRSTYIPPHMRGVPPPGPDGPSSMMNGSMGDGAWNGARLAWNYHIRSPYTRLIRFIVVTSATVWVAHTSGPTHQTSPLGPTVLR